MTKKEFEEYIELEVYKNSKNFLSRMYYRYLNPSTNAVYLFRKMQYIDTQKGMFSKLRVEIVKRELATKYGIMTSPSAKIGKGLRFPHPTSIVIGACVNAGKNLTLYQNTTIGGARTGDVKKGNQPVLGDNVTLFASSMILGKVHVGDNVILGANSLLLKSVDKDSICVGSPAKCVNKEGK